MLGLTKNTDMTFENLRVLVTGDTGFKGSWLCECLLMQNAKVFGIGLEPNTDPSLFLQLNLDQRINHKNIDIKDFHKTFSFVKEVQPDIVFHLAAQPLVRLSYDDPVDTFCTNMMGTVNVLESLRQLNKNCVGIMVTTDKCYDNKEQIYSYKENDRLGGFDPYSASKGACELIIDSYRKSFFTNSSKHYKAIASARAGNVIGGGDWAKDRIVPDCIRSLSNCDVISIRNPLSTRPWQHVMEPISGYMQLASKLYFLIQNIGYNQTNLNIKDLCGPFNFGPNIESNRNVKELVKEIIRHWPGEWRDDHNPKSPHEAKLLNLNIEKAYHLLGWKPKWCFEKTIKETITWYKENKRDVCIQKKTRRQIINYFDE